jgi:hypothetical protein
MNGRELSNATYRLMSLVATRALVEEEILSTVNAVRSEYNSSGTYNVVNTHAGAVPGSLGPLEAQVLMSLTDSLVNEEDLPIPLSNELIDIFCIITESLTDVGRGQLSLRHYGDLSEELTPRLSTPVDVGLRDALFRDLLRTIDTSVDVRDRHPAPRRPSYITPAAPARRATPSNRFGAILTRGEDS